jgi:EAL domain-containing protein (putative c-di-GMP-specific phosphodiesterase class I)
MQHAAQNRMRLEMDLREALARREFFLVYQPTFDLRDMRPSGVEALLRWQHPSRGVVQPNDFIPMLEESGMIVEVGRWVLAEACRQTAAWRRRGHAIGVAVNVSGRQFNTDELIEDVQRALTESGQPPSALTLEITETTMMRDLSRTAGWLREIRQRGVRVAIDDFGTGYSSLAHLQRFPVDALKIDKSFVYHLSDSEESETMIRTLVQLGNALSIETLAEGIEQPRELSVLQHEHCDAGQGFLLARPMRVSAIEAFLSDYASAPTGAQAMPASSAPGGSGSTALSGASAPEVASAAATSGQGAPGRARKEPWISGTPSSRSSVSSACVSMPSAISRQPTRCE